MRYRKKDNIGDALRAFSSHGKEKKTVFAGYRIEGDRLFYRGSVSDEIKPWRDEESFKKFYVKVREAFRHEDGRLKARDGTEVELESLSAREGVYGLTLHREVRDLLAVRVRLPDGSFRILTNSESFSHVPDREAAIKALSRFRSLPLSIFLEADLSTFSLIEEGKAVSVSYEKKVNGWREEKVEEEFSPLLFSLSGETYLYDFDRESYKRDYFVPFLTRLIRPVSSIAEAYVSLKPEAVIRAEERGLEVKRIGPVFLVSCPEGEGPHFRRFTLREVVRVLESAAHSSLDKSSLEFLHREMEGVFGEMSPGSLSEDSVARSICEEIPREERIPDYREFTSDALVVKEGLTYVRENIGSPEHGTIELNGWYRVYLTTAMEARLNEERKEKENEIPF